MIQLRNLSIAFDGKTVLHELNLTVTKGESVALLGLSGSGKTTALKTIAGLITPQTGSVMVGNELLTPVSVGKVRRHLGYVIQDGGLFPHLTLFQNLALVGAEAGLTPAEINSRVAVLATLTKLSPEILARYPRQVSGGQRQRVGLMRALLLDPDYLLLDEPLGALDPITRRELQDELKEIFSGLGKTVVLVTHDLFEADHLAQRIVLLDGGSIAQEGKMEDLIERPANDFVRRFVRAQADK